LRPSLRTANNHENTGDKRDSIKHQQVGSASGGYRISGATTEIMHRMLLTFALLVKHLSNKK